MTGGAGVRVSALTIKRAHHKKKALMGRQKGLHSKGRIHIYSHVLFHVFLPILSCTSPLGCWLPEKLFVLTKLCSVQALLASTAPMHYLTAEKRGLGPRKKGAKSVAWHAGRPPDNLRQGWGGSSGQDGGGEQPCGSGPVQPGARRRPQQSQVLSFLS